MNPNISAYWDAQHFSHECSVAKYPQRPQTPISGRGLQSKSLSQHNNRLVGNMKQSAKGLKPVSFPLKGIKENRELETSRAGTTHSRSRLGRGSFAMCIRQDTEKDSQLQHHAGRKMMSRKWLGIWGTRMLSVTLPSSMYAVPFCG